MGTHGHNEMLFGVRSALLADEAGLHAPVRDESLQCERDHFKILVDVTNAVLSTLDIEELAVKVAEAVHHFFGLDYICLCVPDTETSQIHTYEILYSASGRLKKQFSRQPATQLPATCHLGRHALILADRLELNRFVAQNPCLNQLVTEAFQSASLLPLQSGAKSLGSLVLGSHLSRSVFSDNSALLHQVAARIALALDNALAYQEISRLKDRLDRENQLLTQEISHYEHFDEIIGQSAAMSAVLEQVEMVASSDCSVLILGDTGTGKELIARAIHKLSPRNQQRMVTMNCAAIPAGLLESDLFGHEKGAFTGASSQRLGRFEMAQQGTLFLDEVGDIPLELQPKLLRVLQEREVERVGGSKIIPVDVRVIAATSCDLKQMIADKQYRSDLYYRLNVFPIVVPPLRDRPEDVPLLAQFFTRQFARKLNRNIDSIPTDTIARLVRHPWPGNVRELQNVIERAVILTRGPVLNLPLNDLQYEAAAAQQRKPLPPRSISLNDDSDDERDRIISVLKETNGVVAGPKGAAARLGLKRTTLLSRMQRLGISVKTIEEQDLS